MSENRMHAHEYEAMSQEEKIAFQKKEYDAYYKQNISDALKDQFGIEIDKKKIVMNNPIKMLGEYTVDAKLYQEVTGQVKVLVEA